MADAGPSLLPGVIDVEYSRGHPLLFHFLGGVWVTVFGKSFVALHSYALTISISFLVLIWFQIRNLINIQSAFFFLLFSCLQLMFVAQSSMVLPEVMLAGFSLLAILFYLNKSFIGFAIACSLALLTKESGLVVYASVNLIAFVSLLKGSIDKKDWMLCLSPMLVFIAFFCFQYSVYNWFFFPEHTGMIKTDITQLFREFIGCLQIIFIEQNRSYLFLGLSPIIAYLFWKKNNLVSNKNSRDVVYHLGLFIFMYLVFSVFNFISARYLLSPILASILLFTFLSTPRKNSYGIYLLLFVLTIPFLTIVNRKYPYKDVNLSYLKYAEVHSEVIRKMESLDIYDKYIYSGFLSYHGLKEPYAGYRSSDIEFTKLNVYDEKPQKHYFLIDKIETSFKKNAFAKDSSALLVYRYEEDSLWYELYYFDLSQDSLKTN